MQKYLLIGPTIGLVGGLIVNRVVDRLPAMHDAEVAKAVAMETGAPMPDTQKISLFSRPAHAMTQVQLWRSIWIIVLSMALATLAFWRLGDTREATAGLVLIFALLAIGFIDAATRTIHDSLSLPLIWAGLLVSLPGYFAYPADAIAGAAAGYLSLYLVGQAALAVTKHEGIGQGDAKLFAAIGAWLGWQSLAPILLIASLMSFLVVGSLAILKRKTALQSAAFGPFLALATFIWLFARPL